MLCEKNMEKLSKQECEEYEIVGFITVYKNLEHGRKFTVVETRENLTEL